MRILVTGGAGYVGGFAARHLLRAGHDVVALDDLSQGHRLALPEDVLVVGDVGDRALVGRLLRERRVEAVMHFAAAVSVSESVARPEHHWRNNAVHTLGLLETMLEHDVRRIVFSSTAATYGSAEEMPLTEDAAQSPTSPYGASKLAVEWMIRQLADAHGLGYVILRYFNAAGAANDGSHGEDHRPETHLIPLVLQAALGGRECVEIYGDDWETRDGTCVRDYVHVEDLALAHELAVAKCPERGGHVWNVGTGSGTTVMEVVRAAREVTGREVPCRIAERRPGDPAELVASSDRLRAALGWKPAYPDIAQVVETAWKWHASHPGGYES